MSGTDLLNLHMFKKLCGPNCFRSLVLATTFWDTAHKVSGKPMDDVQLCEEFWNDVLASGAYYMRYEGGTDGAQALLQCMLANQHIFTAAIQVEMIDNMLNLNDTEVGMELDAHLKALKEPQQRNLRMSKEYFAQTNNREIRKDLELEIQVTERLLAENKATREMLRVNFETIYNRDKDKRSVLEQRSNALIGDLDEKHNQMQPPSRSKAAPAAGVRSALIEEAEIRRHMRIHEHEVQLAREERERGKEKEKRE